MSKVEFVNPMSDYSFLNNRELSEIFAKASIEETCERMDEFGNNRWFTSDNPAVVALYQLRMGQKYVTTRNTITTAVSNVLGLNKVLTVDEIEDHWDDIYKKVREVVGQKESAEILKEKSPEELDRELEDILKIDQNFWNS